jgi:hypothetical protein
VLRAGGSGERIKTTMNAIIGQLTKLISNVRREIREIDRRLQRPKELLNEALGSKARGASSTVHSWRILCHDLRLDMCDLAVVVATLRAAISVVKTGKSTPLPASISDFTWEMYVPDLVSVRARMTSLCELLALNLYNAEVEGSGTWPGHGWAKDVTRRLERDLGEGSTWTGSGVMGGEPQQVADR